MPKASNADDSYKMNFPLISETISSAKYGKVTRSVSEQVRDRRRQLISPTQTSVTEITRSAVPVARSLKNANVNMSPPDLPVLRKQSSVVTEKNRLLSETDVNHIVNCMEIHEKESNVKQFKTNQFQASKMFKPRKNKGMYLNDVYDILFGEDTYKQKRMSVLTLQASVTSDSSSKDVAVIIDTGCNLNILRSDLAKGIELNKNNIPKLMSANNRPLHILGSAEIEVQIGDVKLVDTFFVAENLAAPVILGNIFLFRNNVEISYLTHTVKIIKNNQEHLFPMSQKWLIHLENLSEQVQNPIQQVNLMTDVKLAEDIIVAPHQHLTIKTNAKLDKTSNVETDKSFRDKRKCHLYLAQTQNGETFINIYNASNFAKRIVANTVIGYLINTKDSKADQSSKPINNTSTSQGNGKRIMTDRNGEILNISSHLSIEEHNRLVDMLENYRHLFTTKTTDLGEANVPHVKIPLKANARPVSVPPYRQSAAERVILNKKLTEMIEAGILEECKESSPYSSPVFIAKSANKEERVVTDFRLLNQSCIQDDAYPIPSIDLVLSSLSQAHSFTMLDLKQSFHLLGVDKSCREALTIRSQDRMLRYARLPMGLKVSTAIFSRVVNSLLNKILYSKCVNYLDDIICFGQSYETDLNNLQEVLEVISKANLALNTKKCRFMYKSTEILGYKVSTEGIKPLEKSVKAIRDFKRPENVREVRSFVGCITFFRKWIPNLSTIAAPLTDLLKTPKKGSNNVAIPFAWTQACESAFNKMKELLTSAPLLSHFREDRDTCIYVDSSKIGMGAILVQRDENSDRLHPISYMSKKYNKAQQQYPSVHAEFLALVSAVVHFREYIYGRKITVYTDCAALVHYKSFKFNSARLSRFALALVDYQLEVKHKPGSANTLADALSRNPVQDEFVDETAVDPLLLTVNAIEETDVRLEQARDPYLRGIKLALDSPDLADKKHGRASRLYCEQDGIIYYKHYDGNDTKHLLAVPKSLTNDILKAFHDSIHSGGHFSFFKTLSKIKQKYHWPDMHSQILSYTKTCHECQLRRPKTHKNYGLLQPQVPSTQVMDRVIIDFWGPITSSYGHKYVLVCTDSCSRYAFAFPCRNADAKTVAQKLIDLSNHYGYPRVITHDQGTHFTGSVLKQFTSAIGVEQRPSCSYMPRVQGLSERFNYTLCKALSHFSQDKPQSWSKYVDFVTFTYNTSVNKSTGYSPFYLMFGREANLPSDYLMIPKDVDVTVLDRINIIDEVRKKMPEIISAAQQTQKKYFDRDKTHLELAVGDEVLIEYPKRHTEDFNKFVPAFKGPFTVKSKINDVTYGIEIFKYGKLVVEPVHVARIKLFHKRL